VKERKWNKSEITLKDLFLKKKENTTSLPVPEITLKDLFLKRDSESRRDISSLSVPEIKKGLKDD